MAASRMVPIEHATEDDLYRTAEEVITTISDNTTIFDPVREAEFPRFEESELKIGRILGRGGYCVVSEIVAFDLQEESTKETNNGPGGGQLTRATMAARAQRNGSARYAIKVLGVNYRDNPGRFLQGILDLAIEMRFLAVVSHPHIIKMRAVSTKGSLEKGFFVVLDRLYDTLGVRIKKWQKTDQKSRGITGCLTGGKRRQRQLMIDRLLTSCDLASALTYLHSLNIIYRDLKPENVGFDVRGDVKIFDFGLSKELQEDDRMPDGTYKMTGFTGSLRYMAPEVAQHMPYNLSADTFAFGMLFWHILSLEPPYATFTVEMHQKFVVQQGYRPVLKAEWNESLCRVMKACWAGSKEMRPSMPEISEMLQKELNRLIPGYDPLDMSTKSNKTEN